MAYKVVKPGDIVRVTLPYSEVCMHLRVAGDVMDVKVLEHGVQLVNSDGSNHSFPITHGEAGVYTPMGGEWYTDTSERCATIGCTTAAMYEMTYTHMGEAAKDWVCNNCLTDYRRRPALQITNIEEIEESE